MLFYILKCPSSMRKMRMSCIILTGEEEGWLILDKVRQTTDGQMITINHFYTCTTSSILSDLLDTMVAIWPFKRSNQPNLAFFETEMKCFEHLDIWLIWAFYECWRKYWLSKLVFFIKSDQNLQYKKNQEHLNNFTLKIWPLSDLFRIYWFGQYVKI